MTRTLIDVDDDALAAAAEELGTTTKVETVNRALLSVGGRGRRLAFLDHMATADDDLEDTDTMRDAWR